MANYNINVLYVLYFSSILILVVSSVQLPKAENDQDEQCFNSLIEECSTDPIEEELQQLQNDTTMMMTMNSTVQTWQVCCLVYRMIDCYTENVSKLCLQSSMETVKAVLYHNQDIINSIRFSICKSIDYFDRNHYCHEERRAKYVDALGYYLGSKPTFIDVPSVTSGPESKCFEKLQNSSNKNIKAECIDEVNNRWDNQKRGTKLWESSIGESCCAGYQLLNCIQRRSVKVCNSTEELLAMEQYRNRGLQRYSQSVCKWMTEDGSNQTTFQSLCQQFEQQYETTPEYSDYELRAELSELLDYIPENEEDRKIFMRMIDNELLEEAESSTDDSLELEDNSTTIYTEISNITTEPNQTFLENNTFKSTTTTPQLMEDYLEDSNESIYLDSSSMTMELQNANQKLDTDKSGSEISQSSLPFGTMIWFNIAATVISFIL